MGSNRKRIVNGSNMDSCFRRNDRQNRILLGHGSGGRLSQELTKSYFLKEFQNPILGKLDDSGVFKKRDLKISLTTDSYVVHPIFFPGGDIGKLAVCGTINDLCMAGATPLYLSCGFIIEEGFLFEDLKIILKSMKEISSKCGVEFIAGDTKVVDKGKADGIFINTTGIGFIENEVNISSSNARKGDNIIISGPIAEHGMAIMSARMGMNTGGILISDCAPLKDVVLKVLKNYSKYIHVLRDPTRGGLGVALNEIASTSKVEIEICEDKIPIRENVKGMCEMLGFDPLYVPSEGRFIAFVDSKKSNEILDLIKTEKISKRAIIIGEVVKKSKKGSVLIQTLIGTKRIVIMPAGELLPRIC